MRRHDLAYVRPGAALRFHCGIADELLSARVMGWIVQGRPLVVARQAADSDALLLGLTLPAASDGRRRVGCLVKREDVLEVRAPLGILDCLGRLDESVAAPLAALAGRLAGHRIRAGVYGSLAWETLSGQVYRHAASDVDLICDIDSADQLNPCLAALAEAAANMPCGLDGEIRFPDGSAVAWRELAAALGKPGAQVLVKGEVEVGMQPVSALMAQFEEEASHV
ncbi:MAG: malonate decarboxylase holo-[acyl-carrier-protein] synthase [Zoogloea sp.]|nr:malonate decarboxylase holo-[acyl-carrier-protein] synthase [Zoogloea sp.]